MGAHRSGVDQPAAHVARTTPNAPRRGAEADVAGGPSMDQGFVILGVFANSACRRPKPPSTATGKGSMPSARFKYSAISRLDQ